MACPIGSSGDRIGLSILATALTAMVLVHWEGSPLPWVTTLAATHHQTVSRELELQGATLFEQLRFGGLTWIVALAAVVLLPVVLPWGLAFSLTVPALTDAAALRDRAASATSTESILNDIRRSPDLIERDSVYLGRVVADGSPSLVPRGIYQEHAHGLGDSGSGKTSLFLCPLIEQLVRGGDCSVIVLDLKADTMELLATLQTAAEAAHRDRGLRMPLKVFSNQAKRTFGFNPMTQPFWSKFDLFTRTDILCGATGLTYGTDYGMGYYSSANAAILYHTLKTYPETTTFRELAEAIGTVITTAKKRDLNPEIRKAGVHVQELMKRLAACEPLNVTASSGHDAEAVEEGIDLTQAFQLPQLLYFHLSATLSPSGAPEIARLVNYMLLAAATQTERKHPVFLVIDEFQRMVASNLEFMLQLARSMGVGVILANQSMADLKKSTTNLIPAIEANCRLRQWFSVSSSEDQKRLIDASGLAVDYERSRSVTTNANGEQSVSRSLKETVVPRLTLNDILLTSDHPFRSILRISRGSGYAQYGGFPVVIESEFHISQDEYDRRRKLPWPQLPGSFLPGSAPEGNQPHGASSSPSAPPTGPQWSEEVIGPATTPLSEADSASLASLFEEMQQTTPAPSPRGRRKRS
ncbi:MAG: TraM recognition domain-containing protein [Gemmatimonadaceae bacterium]|nr:TraM recognition domain-containing protein [Gemmatimonadaceae bacterium]